MTTELHPAAAAVRAMLPAQVCHGTAESGAGIDFRMLVEHDVDAMSGRIAAAVLRWLANKIEVEADWQRRDPRHERHAYVIGVPRLYDLADEIEATTRA